MASRTLRHRVALGDRELLANQGPVLTLRVGRPGAAGGFDGHSMSVPMMLDTGAHVSVLGTDVTQALGLPTSRASQRLRRPVDGFRSVDLYSVRYELTLYAGDGSGPVDFSFNMPTAGLPPFPPEEVYRGLLGRDILRLFDVAYSGTEGHFALTLRQHVEPS